MLRHLVRVLHQVESKELRYLASNLAKEKPENQEDLTMEKLAVQAVVVIGAVKKDALVIMIALVVAVEEDLLLFPAIRCVLSLIKMGILLEPRFIHQGSFSRLLSQKQVLTLATGKPLLP